METLHAKSDISLLKQIGTFCKSNRLYRRLTQAQLAERAGLNRTTISQLENEGNASLNTLIRVLRILDRLDVLRAFDVEKELSPAIIARMERKRKQRVSAKMKQPEEPTLPSTEKPLRWE